MDAVKGVLGTVSGVFGTVSGVLGPILGFTGRVFSTLGDILTKFSIGIFLAGFFGILLAFLWFFFRYLDKKKLTLPTVIFTVFFFIFLSGNLLLIARDAEMRDAADRETAVVQTSDAETASGGEVAV